MDDIVVMIMDPDGEILAPGQEGEIVAQGARVMSGYLNREEDTSAAIKDGWLHTGDVGWMDDDGYLYITGRTKDLIIRGGENIAPGEIEAVLQQHDAVEDCAVIGVPDVEWGEEVKAVVVLKPGQSRDTRRAVRVREGAPRQLQGPEVLRVRRRAAAQLPRQGPQDGPAQAARRSQERGVTTRERPSATGVELGEMRPDELDEAAALLAAAYRDNALTFAMLGDDPERRYSVNEGIHRFRLRAMDPPPIVARRDGRLVGVSGFDRPGGSQPSTDEQQKFLERLLAAGILQRAQELLADFDRNSTKVDHWHLGPVGVSPDAQRHRHRHSHGRAVLRARRCARCCGRPRDRQREQRKALREVRLRDVCGRRRYRRADVVHAPPGEDMTRRREARRRQRIERKERDPDAVAQPAATPPPKAAQVRDISVMGVVGGLAGILPFSGVAIGILFDPGIDEKWIAAIFAVIALAFVPVTVASIVNTPRRRSVQRVTVFACLGLAAGGSLLTGTLIVAMLLAIPTTLLAIAAGIVFQGKGTE